MNTFQTNTVDYYFSKNRMFIYPITLYSTDLFIKYETIELNDLLLKCIKNKTARIVFFYTTEGDWGTHQFHFDWIDRLIDKYQFDYNDILMITTNLKAKENYKGDKFKIIPYNFFIDDLEFISLNKMDKNSLKKFEENYNKYISNNKTQHKTKHFVCFNGIPRLNRLLIFGAIKTNPILNNTTLLSLRNTSTNDNKTFYNEVKECLNKDIVNFFKNYDSTKNYSYDTDNWDKIYSWGNFVNEPAHNSTFINVVTETMWNNESIFFTEKIYKPIYMCQPFILFGNPNSLKKLKEIGFKTFDKWWDESYDLEMNLELRLKKIITLMEEIAKWDFSKCFQITNEMEETLIHNYNRLMSNEDLLEIYLSLQTDIRVIKKSII